MSSIQSDESKPDWQALERQCAVVAARRGVHPHDVWPLPFPCNRCGEPLGLYTGMAIPYHCDADGIALEPLRIAGDCVGAINIGPS